MNGFDILKNTVIDKNLCCFCGTCIGMCPTNYIGYENEVIIKAGNNCIDCHRCIKSCPGKDFDFKYYNTKLFSQLPESIHGYYCDIYKGSTGLKEVSSGGFATTIALYLLKEKYIDGVIGVIQQNLDVEVKILKTKSEILSAAQSKYVFVPVNKIIKEILANDGKYLFIGLPCQIQGIRKAADVDRRITNRVYMYISIFCGFNLSIDATKFLVKKSKIKEKEINSIEYRAKYGNETGFLLKGEKNNFFINKHGYTILNMFFSKERCWKCYDYTGEFADISLGDAWEMENGSRIIIRTNLGGEILQSMMSSTLISIGGGIYQSSIDDIYNYSKKIVNYKKYHFYERNKVFRNQPNYNIIYQKISMKEKVKAKIFAYILILCQTKFVKYILQIIPIKVLSKISISLRGNKAV